MSSIGEEAEDIVMANELPWSRGSHLRQVPGGPRSSCENFGSDERDRYPFYSGEDGMDHECIER